MFNLMKRRSAGWVVCALGLAAVGAVPASAAIVAHYTFDEAPGATVVHDSENSGVSGTLSGTTAAFVAGGKSGNALSLTAANNDVANFGNNFGFTGGTSFTASIWAKIPNGSTAAGVPFAKHFATQFVGYLMGMNDINDGSGSAATGKAHFYVSGSVGSLSTANINDGQFHLLTGVYHGGGSPSMDLYVDGVFQNTTASGAVVSTTAPFVVGGVQSNTSGNPIVGAFTGTVDDLQLYNTALTATDVQFLFTHPGQATPEPTAIAVLAAPLVLLMRRRSRRVCR